MYVTSFRENLHILIEGKQHSTSNTTTDTVSYPAILDNAMRKWDIWNLFTPDGAPLCSLNGKLHFHLHINCFISYVKRDISVSTSYAWKLQDLNFWTKTTQMIYKLIWCSKNINLINILIYIMFIHIFILIKHYDSDHNYVINKKKRCLKDFHIRYTYCSFLL